MPAVTTFIFDYDGVMTDGKVYTDADGRPWRASNVKDGYALQLASKLGYNVALISGATCPSMIQRMNSLNVFDVFTGVPNKILKLNEYMAEKNLKPEQVVYMGDDIPDIGVMRMVGVPVCPADAAEEVKEISVYISNREGGKGCVRDMYASRRGQYLGRESSRLPWRVLVKRMCRRSSCRFVRRWQAA